MRLHISFLRNTLAVSLFLLATLAGWGQGATLDATTYFEGLVQYRVTYSGEVKETFDESKVNTNMDLALRNGHFIIQMYGGTVDKTLLYNADSNWTYSIDVAEKKIYLLEKHRQRVKQQPEVTPTGDSVKVLGKWCYGYRFSKPATPKYPASTTTLYINPEYRINLAYYEGKDISQAYWSLKGLQGCIPLKIVFEDPTMRIESTAERIRPMPLREEEFRLPPGFKILRWDQRR